MLNKNGPSAWEALNELKFLRSSYIFTAFDGSLLQSDRIRFTHGLLFSLFSLARVHNVFSCAPPPLDGFQLLNIMSGEIKRDLKEDNAKDDALTKTYNALKVRTYLPLPRWAVRAQISSVVLD